MDGGCRWHLGRGIRDVVLCLIDTDPIDTDPIDTDPIDTDLTDTGLAGTGGASCPAEASSDIRSSALF